MRVLHLSVLLVLLFGSHASSADEIRFATEAAHPPFNMKDDNGQLKGFDVDLVNAMCYAMQSKCTIQAVDSSEFLQGLLDDRFDAVIATSSVLSLNDDQIVYTDPYYSSFLRFVAKMNKDQNTDSLTGKKLGAVKGSAAARYLSESFSESATVELFDDADAAWQALKEGQLDAVLDSVLQGYNWLADVENIGYDYAGDVIDINQKSGIALHKEDAELKEKLNQSLKTLMNNGTFQHINRSYFPFNVH